MSTPARILAIGSPHGDDRVGWLVAELLRGRGMESTWSIQNVDELLWHLTSDSRTIIVDACQSGAPVGSQFRFVWPDSCLQTGKGVTSHGIDIPYVLRLAEALGKLPKEVVLFAIEGRSSSPGQEMSAEVVTSAHALADRIEREVSRANEVTDA